VWQLPVWASGFVFTTDKASCRRFWSFEPAPPQKVCYARLSHFFQGDQQAPLLLLLLLWLCVARIKDVQENPRPRTKTKTKPKKEGGVEGNEK